MKNYNYSFAGVTLLFLLGSCFSSCQKVIDLDLNSSDPKIVVEATISDQPGPYTVMLTKTVNFDESNTFPPVSGAIVKMSDDIGNNELLSETSPGVYTTASILGVPGRTYTLEATADGKTYTAVSKMPSPINIDTLLVEESGSSFGVTKFITAQYNDPAGIINFYRFVLVVNGKEQDDLVVDEDRLQDGQTITQAVFARFGRGDSNLFRGDTASVYLQSIDKGVYEYFRTLLQVTESSSSAPANPLSNFNNGALGYFSAYAKTSKTIVVP